MRRIARYSALRPAVLGMGRILGTGLSAAAAHPLSIRAPHTYEPDSDSEGSSLVVLLVASMSLVLLGGAFAGLTIA